MSQAACRGDRDGWDDGVRGAVLSSTVAASPAGAEECFHTVAAVRDTMAAVSAMVAAVSGMVTGVDGMVAGVTGTVTGAPR